MKQLYQNLNIRSETQQQLKESLKLLKMILGSDLLGVYLYGSSLVGGLQKYSDIDLFVVTNRVTTSEEKTRLIANLLQISGIYMKSSKLPIEMTLVEKAAINPWQYPPHFDFQYGEWLRESFEKGIIEPWLIYEMPDLALIVTQVLLKSQTLWGLKPEQLLAHVPYHDFMKAMLHDLNRLGADLEHDTRNVLLTYARIWSTLETNAIRSKPAAADWVMNHLPKIYQPVMKRAKSICIGKENEYWDDVEVLIKSCADFIVNKINAKISLVNFDDPNKLIKLAEEPFSGDSSLYSGLRGELLKKSKLNSSRELIIVRPYQEKDTEELAKIYYHTIHKINSRDYSKEQIDVWAPETSLQPEGWLKKFQRTKPFVATTDGKVVGFAEFEPNGHIDCFYCHHDWIGKGVGSALLKAINEKAMEYNVDKIFAEVSITAKPFFEKNGFKVTCEQKVERKGIKLLNFQMEKRLSR